MLQLSRRKAAQLLARAAVALAAPFSYLSIRGTTEVLAEEFAADRKTIEQWMDQWMIATKQVSGSLHVQRFADPIYILTKPINWKPNPGEERLPAVTVPIGFVTDFASIPRLFWSALRPDGNYTFPAIVHDYMYWTQLTSREDADDILKFGMQDMNIAAATVIAIYSVVYLFGGIAWNSNAKLKAAGEKRILRRFPDSPTTTWDEWKQDKENFQC